MNVAGTRQINAVIDRILQESVSLSGMTDIEKAMYFAMANGLKEKLVAEMSRTGLIFNCPRLDAGRCMYFATEAQLEELRNAQ